MGKFKHAQISLFRLEGRFLGFVVEDGYKIKRIRLATGEGEFELKLAKEARTSLSQVLTPGDWVEVSGEQKLEKDGGQKLKVYQVLPKAPSPTQIVPPAPAKTTAKPPACILVCQKSDCCKRGAMQVTQELAEALRDRGLENQVSIKGTGCMKHCKAGPNIVIMPDKTAYRRVDPAEIPQLIDQHFAPKNHPLDLVPEPSLVG